MPGEGFTTWDYSAIAQHFYQKYSQGRPADIKQKFDDVVQKIITIIEKELALDRLDKAGIWSWCTLKSGKEWPLSKWIIVNTVAPYKRARNFLKKS